METLKRTLFIGATLTMVILLIGLLIAHTTTNIYHRKTTAATEAFAHTIAKAAQADSLEEAQSFPNDTAR